MFRGAIKISRKIKRCTSGNALLLVAIGMPVLIGGAGLGLDTAQWYLWKRELQHSVDQAAIGAAHALANVDAKATYEARAHQEFNANQAVTKAFSTTPVVTLADYAGGSQNSVIVTASASRHLPFSSFLTGRATSISVRAQASFAAGGNYHACLIALAEDEDNVLGIGGNATVKAQCGLAALSCEEDAVVIDDSATVLTDSIATCGTADVPEELEGTVAEGVDGLQDIFAELTPPDNPTPKSYECSNSGTKGKKQASLTPGTYSGLVVKCSTVLAPGIYVIDGGELDLSANYDVTGTNVMFVLKNHARLKLGGAGNSNAITLSPMQAADFVGTPYEDQADKLAGMLIFEHRDNSPPSPGHQLNGNSNSLVEGTMYLPSGEMTVLGTADVASQCLQISAYKIAISGSANLETLCPVDDTNSAGSGLAQVRLVA